MSQVAFAPSSARKLGVLVFALLGAFVLAIGGCSETRKGLGETCLKDGDCVSNFCSATVCIAEPPVLTDANATDTSTAVIDTGTDGADGSLDGSPDGANVPDVTNVSDASNDAADAVTEAAI